MKKIFLYILFMLLPFTLVNAQKGYYVNTSLTVEYGNGSLNYLAVWLSYPQTNQYQTVLYMDYADSKLCEVENSEDKYLFYEYLEEDLQEKEGLVVSQMEFAINIHEFHFDFSSVTSIFPYDQNDEDVIRYTGESGEYVMPNHPKITTIADRLWNQSSDIIDYARKCYDYVPNNYAYINPNTGLHTIDHILSNGGGDCGNLSSIFVSLLRNKGIPARHVVTYRPDGTFHVWAEFMLQGYGWIPVDVTAKQGNPSGNYFGHYTDTGIIVGQDVWNNYNPWEEDNDFYFFPLLQSYIWAWWGDTATNVKEYWQVKSTVLDVSDVKTIEETPSHKKQITGVFNMQGQKVGRRKGFNIIKMADGTTSKVYTK